MKLNLLVLRTYRLEELRAFYSALGAKFEAEQHGSGPKHYAATLGAGLVLELYPCQEGASLDAGTRFGLAVADLRQALCRVGQPVTPKETPWGLQAVVRDPDGRTIELSQSE